MIDEPGYSFGSSDNVHRYDAEIDLSGGYRPSSIHGVFVDGRSVMVIGDSGGVSGVHDHSLVVLDPLVFVAVGAHVVCFTLGHQEPNWTLRVDDATCFGVHYDPLHDALISHGELSICRFNRDGSVVWSAGGADIFSEGFTLRHEHVEAVDFDHRIYRFDFRTGQTLAEQGADGNPH
jgi:hypothetical protein